MEEDILPDEDTAGGSAQGQDSAVIKALRQREKELAGRIRELEGAANTAIEQARAEVKREASAFQIVNELGFPKLAPLVVEKIQGDVTEESVRAFLAGIGLEAQSGASGSGSGAPQASAVADVAGVASLGQQLASAARGAGGGSVIDRLAAAQNADEVAKIATEAGFASPY